MSEETPVQAPAAQPAEAASAPAAAASASEAAAPTAAGDKADEPKPESAPAEKDDEKKTEEPAATADAAPAEDKPADADAEMKDSSADKGADAPEPVAEPKSESEKPADSTPTADQEVPAATGQQAATTAAASASQDATAADKPKGRRKSGIPDHVKGGKKLNKKASKAKITHIDAKPGDHFFAKLKGFPPWPVVVSTEDMLPQTMLNTRPVTAARPDGSYREDFADGGKRVGDRTFPVMYLYTNEFSWIPNTDLSDLDPTAVVSQITTKMRKDLQEAHSLAAEQHDLDYYKNVLREFEDQRLAKIEAAEAKKKAKTSKKSKAPEPADEDGDVEMADADDDGEAAEKKPKSKKRKAEEDSNTPQRSDSVKKPKIKLTTSSTPKAANGAQSPKSGKDKSSKSKGKGSKNAKDGDSKKAEKEAAPKEPELTPEERRVRKEKEILFLRHRLQKGLLIRDQEPKEDEMKPMSEFLAKLEQFPDLEVSIIKATKINKVLKAILKLEKIPKEDEFQFKPRSQGLLDKWNKLLATDATAPAANGVNGTSKTDKEAANGVKDTPTESKATSEPKKEDAKAESSDSGEKKDGDAKAEPKGEAKGEKATEEETKAAPTEAHEAVESTA